MQILRDPSLSSYHQKVVRSLVFIFKVGVLEDNPNVLLCICSFWAQYHYCWTCSLSFYNFVLFACELSQWVLAVFLTYPRLVQFFLFMNLVFIINTWVIYEISILKLCENYIHWLLNNFLYVDKLCWNPEAGGNLILPPSPFKCPFWLLTGQINYTLTEITCII